MTRYSWIKKTDAIALSGQCVLAGVPRATLYAQQKFKLLESIGVEGDDLLKRLIDEEYTRPPFFGRRKMLVYLGRCGRTSNRKRVQRDAYDGHGTGPQHKQSTPAAQGVPVSAARRAHHQAQQGLEYRYHLYQAGTRFCLSGGHHRLVFPAGAELENQQQHGGGVLRRLTGGCLADARQPEVFNSD